MAHVAVPEQKRCVRLDHLEVVFAGTGGGHGGQVGGLDEQRLEGKQAGNVYVSTDEADGLGRDGINSLLPKPTWTDEFCPLEQRGMSTLSRLVRAVWSCGYAKASNGKRWERALDGFAGGDELGREWQWRRTWLVFYTCSARVDI